MADKPKVHFESRMLIDGKLVDGEAGTFDEHQPGHRGGARRGRGRIEGRHASRDRRRAPRLRQDGLVDQPRAAQALPRAAPAGVGSGAGRAPRRAHPRGRLPAHGDARSAAGRSAARRAHVSRQADRRVPLGDEPRRRRRRAHESAHHAEDLARAGGSGRRDRALELPVRGHDQQARSSARDGKHGGVEARAGHAVQRDTPRAPDRRAHRHPARGGQRRHRFGPSRRRGAHALAQGRPDLVHGLDRRRQEDHGEGRGDDEAPVPRARREVGHDRARGREPRWRMSDRHRAVHARGAGVCDSDADVAAAIALRRGRGDSQRHVRGRSSPATRRNPARYAAP